MRRLAALAVLVSVLGISATVGAVVPATGILRAPEIALGAPSRLPKWRRVLDALRSEEPKLRACLEDAAACRDPGTRAWREAVHQLVGRPLREQLERVNRFFNSFQYKTDWEAWGKSDFWATPVEFLSRSGDCEDYAIAKYVTLRLLGVPEQVLRLVVLHDTRRDLVHAVLAVTDGEDRLILDNLYDRVLPEASLPQYRPYYSVNADGLWQALPSGQTIVLNERQLRPAHR